MRRVLSTSPAAPPTCTSPADPTSIRARSRRRSSPIPRSARWRSSACPTRFGARSASPSAWRARAPAAVTELELATFLAAKGAALQDAETLLLLGRAAEIRLRQGAEAAGARRAGGARVAGPLHQADGLTMRSIAAARPARARAHPVGGGARPRLLLHAGSGPAAAGGRAPRLCQRKDLPAAH